MKFSQFTENGELLFRSPIIQEKWGRITDDALESAFERTKEITFRTPNGKEAPFRKVKYGEWIEQKSNGYVVGHSCSSCGRFFLIDDDGKYEYKFCPNCGADMRGEN